MTQELRDQYRLEITARFEEFKEKFKQGRTNYIVSLNNLMDAIHVSHLFTFS
jgi:thermostable 8-oxoguanine DNA glycosylase